jgi:hypothetical protein
MARAFIPLLVVFLLFPHVYAEEPLPPPSRGPRPALQMSSEVSLPVGTWRVEFANGVTEVCDIQKDGTASVVEPVRIHGGKAVANGSAVVILFENGRVQRWSVVGKRFVVEHWFPGSKFPTVLPGALGIAERAK